MTSRKSACRQRAKPKGAAAPVVLSDRKFYEIQGAAAAVLLLLVLTGVYCSNLRLIATGDSFPTALAALSLVIDHSLTLDRMASWVLKNVEFSHNLVVSRHDHYHNLYPVGQSLLAAPLIAPAALAL